MEIKGVTREQLSDAIVHASPDPTCGNLVYRRCDPLNQAGTRWRVTITVQDSRGRYGRRSAIPGYAGGKSRRVAAACWHGHRDFFRALFDLVPSAVVRSSFAVYRGRDEFEVEFPATYHRNAGSMAYPQAYGSLCDCTGEGA